jgi:hypothetical protein
MKIKVERLIAARQALADLMQQKLRVGVSFWLSRQALAITPVIQGFEKGQLALIQQYGRPAAQPETWTIDPAMPGWDLFRVGLREMLDQEIELLLEPKPLSFLGEVVILSAMDLLALDFLLLVDENVVE